MLEEPGLRMQGASQAELGQVDEKLNKITNSKNTNVQLLLS